MATREQLIAAGTDPDSIAIDQFTQHQVHEAFDRIQDKANWKNPINAVVDGKDLEVTKAAIVFFTGGPAHKLTTTRDGRVEVKAHGYYHYAGA